MAKKQAKKPRANRTTVKRATAKPPPLWQAKFLDTLKNTNCVGVAARAAGIGRQTAYDRRKANAEFATLWVESKQMSIEEVETTLRHRALSGIQKAIWYRGEVVGHETVYDHVLLLAWLNANFPEKYRAGYEIGKIVDALSKRNAAGSDADRP